MKQIIPMKFITRMIHGVKPGFPSNGTAIYARVERIPMIVKAATAWTFLRLASITGPQQTEITPATIPAILQEYPQLAVLTDSLMIPLAKLAKNIGATTVLTIMA